MRPCSTRPRGDDGVSLVLALVFIVIVAMFATVALDKTSSTTVSGLSLRERGDLQYALDGAVDRALQVLKDDVSAATTASPAGICASPPATAGTSTDITQEAGGLSLNGQTVRYSCETLAGTTASVGDTINTNFALILTGEATNSLTTNAGQAQGQNASCSNAGSAVKLGGSVYLSGHETDAGVSKRVLVCGGDLVSHYAGCTDAAAKSVTNLVAETSYLKTCTEQTVDDAVVDVALPTAPGGDNSANIPLLGRPLYQDFLIGTSNNAPRCRVFYPGRYTSAPAVLTAQQDANYMISGLYDLDFASSPASASTWGIAGNTTVVMGRAQNGDVAAAGASTACDTVANSTTDSTLMAGLTTLLSTTGIDPSNISSSYFPGGGATLVVEGSTRVEVAGSLTVNSTTETTPLSFVAARSASDPGQLSGQGDVARGYTAWVGTSTALQNQSASSAIVLNGKLMAPSAPIELFASNPTIGVARAGVVAKSLDIAASVQGGGLAISTPASSTTPAPPPFRTVRITSSTATSSATNVAVATISNYAPFTVSVKSWRTG